MPSDEVMMEEKSYWLIPRILRLDCCKAIVTGAFRLLGAAAAQDTEISLPSQPQQEPGGGQGWRVLSLTNNPFSLG